MKVECIAECSLGTFCNTFDLHKAIIGLESEFLVFFEWLLKTGFTNETHFILYCNLYDELRQNTFGEIFTNTQYTGLNDSEKLKLLFNSTRKCAKFINKAYNLRRSVVYS